MPLPTIRHPLWVVVIAVLLLAAMSGGVDVLAYLRYEVFVANQTGNLVFVQLGLAGVQQDPAVVASIVGLASFTVTVVIAVRLRIVLERRGTGEPTALHQRMSLPFLGGEIVLIAVSAVIIALDPSKRFGLVVVGLLSVSQGLQAVIITRAFGVGIQTVAINTALVNFGRIVGSKTQATALLALATPLGYALGVFVVALVQRGSQAIGLLSVVVFGLIAMALIRTLLRQGTVVE